MTLPDDMFLTQKIECLPILALTSYISVPSNLNLRKSTMLLQYIYVKKYRNFINQGFNLSGRFKISLSGKKIEIEENAFFIEGFFGKSVDDLKILVGENGVGKTSILTYIKEELSFPKVDKDEETKCLVVFFEVASKKFVLATNGIDPTDFEVEVPKGYRKQIKDLTDRKNPNPQILTKKSVLGSIKEFNPSSIILLSNIFDNSGTKEYGHPESPILFDLTTNTLLKQSRLESSTRPLKTSVNYNSIKFILLTRNDSFIPSIQLPDEIRITFNRILIDEYIRNYERKKNDPNAPLSHLFARLSYQNKKQRILYWILANLLIEVTDYIQDGQLPKLVSQLNRINILEEPESFFELLLQSTSDFMKSKRSESRKYERLSKDFLWKNYFTKYREFTKIIVELFEEHDKKSDDFDSFSIPLTNATEAKILNLTNLIDGSEISIWKVMLGWNDLSTGETMLLNFFSTLFVMSRKKKDEIGKSILFLFDEIDTFYHPQWQKTLMKATLDFINFYFSSYNCQIIATGHSPFIISDVPKTNVLFLRRVDNKAIAQDSLDEHLQTFAANIHSLLSDSFFIKNGHIGDFANGKISEVIDILINKPLKTVVENRLYIEKVINIIGEEIIRNKLFQLLEDRLRANLLTIKEDISKLKRTK
jgi:hypothetical protein